MALWCVVDNNGFFCNSKKKPMSLKNSVTRSFVAELTVVGYSEVAIFRKASPRSVRSYWRGNEFAYVYCVMGVIVFSLFFLERLGTFGHLFGLGLPVQLLE